MKQTHGRSQNNPPHHETTHHSPQRKPGAPKGFAQPPRGLRGAAGRVQRGGDWGAAMGGARVRKYPEKVELSPYPFFLATKASGIIKRTPEGQ